MINEIMTEVFTLFRAYETLDVEADEARAKTILRELGFSDALRITEQRRRC